MEDDGAAVAGGLYHREGDRHQTVLLVIVAKLNTDTFVFQERHLRRKTVCLLRTDCIKGKATNTKQYSHEVNKHRRLIAVDSRETQERSESATITLIVASLSTNTCVSRRRH